MRFRILMRQEGYDSLGFVSLCVRFLPHKVTIRTVSYPYAMGSTSIKVSIREFKKTADKLNVTVRMQSLLMPLLFYFSTSPSSPSSSSKMVPEWSVTPETISSISAWILSAISSRSSGESESFVYPNR